MKRNFSPENRLSRRNTVRRGRSTEARTAAVLLTGSFAVACVPGHAAALPVPCPGASACAKLPFDPLNVNSHLAPGASLLSYGNNSLTVNQGNANAAIFNWASFNIGSGNTVTFQQPSVSSVALNRIYDPNVSTISGNLKANGQVYLVNPNGILFGSGANVNVGGLIASTLDISDQRITGGLLNSISAGNPAFSNNATLTGSTLIASANANPAITVQTGATLYAAGRDQSGSIVSAGRVFLFAPTVENAGSITVEGGGQVILAAGTSVYLGSSGDPSLRGLLVEVSGGPSGKMPSVTIDPTGSITVARGNITLMGLAVSVGSDASLTATSALDANGSIYLLARQTNAAGVPQNLQSTDASATGPVSIGSGAQIRVVLDPTDTANAPAGDATASALRSTITIEGSSVSIGGSGNPGATLIQANGGDISVTARTASSTDPVSGALYQLAGNAAALGTANAASTITVGSDAVIDASGLQNVAVDGAQNFTYIDRLTSTNLANAPYQRTGALLGQSVYLNLLQAPSWIDVTNLKSAISETQAQRNATAGTVSLLAEGAVQLAQGSTVNVSGGSIDYSSAIGRTSNLIAANGAIVNIANASPDVQYFGIAGQGSTTVSNPTEGVSVTTSWSVPNYTFAGGFTAGTNAGRLTIYAPQAQLNGTLLASTIASSEQRTTAASGGSVYAAENAGGLQLPTALGGLLQIGSINASTLDSEAGFSRPSIVLTSDPQSAQSLLTGEQSGTPIVLDAPALVASGFSRFDLTSDGIVEVAPQSALNLGALGQLTVRANATVIASSIMAPGGSINVSERPLTTPAGVDPSFQSQSSFRDELNLVTNTSLRGVTTVAPGVTIDVAGTWTNDAYPAPAANPGTPIVLNGGSISLSNRTVNVAGASFNVSAGAYLSPKGIFTGGAGGTLSLSGTYTSPSGLANTVDSGVLNLGSAFASDISGYGVTTGGTLSLYAPTLTIGSSGTQSAGSSTTVDQSVIQQGFQSFNFSAQDALTLASGVHLAPNVELVTNSTALDTTASAATLPAAAQARAAIAGQSFPANFTFGASNAFDGNVTIAANSLVDAGIGSGGKISITAGNRIQIDGSLIAQGGSVSASLGAMPTTGITTGILEGRAIVVDPGAVIDVDGASLVTTNAAGLRSGSVLNAGSVSLAATGGMLATEAGSLISAKGASDQLDIPVSGSQTQRQDIASTGGTLNFSASTGAAIEGTVQASGGGNGAAGGQFSLALLATDPSVLQSGSLPAGVASLLVAPSILNVTPALPSLTPGQASFSTNIDQGFIAPATVNGAGFSQAWLQTPDRIAFTGASGGAPVSLAAPAALFLAAPAISVSAQTAVDIQSAYVALGAAELLSAQTFLSGVSNNAAAPASTGSGTLRVDAGTLDLIGNVSLVGVGLASLNASGDVRAIGTPASTTAGTTASGTLQFAGNLSINSARLYPTTQTIYTISGPTATPGAGSLTIGSNGAAAPSSPVLSAGGSLTLKAANIDVQGSVLAPLGTIAIDATNQLTLEAGSLLSVAADALVPYGTVLNGTTWTFGDPVGNTTVLPSAYSIASPTVGISIPAKSISLNATMLLAQSGSTISVAGGGDVLGIGFVQGPGGSYDWSQNFPVSSSTRNPFFALVPALGTATAPYDAQIYSNLVLNPALTSQPGALFQMGQTITIGAGSALPAGTYTILPPRYALLPGAYAVEAAAGYQNLQPGSAVSMPDGTAIVAGKLGNNAAGTLASEWSGFRVYTNSQFETLSQFQTYTGSSFFPALASSLSLAAPRVGPDAGQLQVVADSVLLNSSIDAAPAASGRGADVQFDVPSIVVTDSPAAASWPSSTLDLSASRLNALDAETLVLGAIGTRSSVSAGGVALAAPATELSLVSPVASNSVNVLALTPVSAGEIAISSANVQIADGARLQAGANANVTTSQVAVKGDGALFYLGSPTQVPSFTRSGASAAGAAVLGQFTVGAATLSGGSTIIDATRNQTYSSAVTFDVAAVNLSAALLNLGPAPAGASGVDLGPSVLANFGKVKELTLTSLGGIAVYGAQTLGQLDAAGAPVLNSVILVGPGIMGQGSTSDVFNINAGQVSLLNPAGASLPASAPGAGQLAISTQATNGASGNIRVSGSVSLAGFQSVTLSATGAQSAGQTTSGTGDIIFAGASGASDALNVLGAASNLSLSATRVTAQSGVNASINVPGSLAISASGPAPSVFDTYDLGASLALNAANVNLSGRLDLPSGLITVASSGTGGIVIGPGADLRAAGVTQTFASTTVDSAAGSIVLTATNGSISEASGATIDVSGSGATGSAGSLVFSAPNGSVTLQGTLALAPGATGQGASVSVDAANLADADAIVNTIAAGAGGSSLTSVSLRARSGNIGLSAAGASTPATSLNAGAITLEADGNGGATDGSIVMNGVLNASGNSGGQISLYANNQITIGGTLDVHANGAGQSGGNILISSRVVSGANTPNTLDAIVIEPPASGSAGALINLSGGSGTGSDGAITLRSTVNPAANDVGIAAIPLGAFVSNQAPNIVVEGVTIDSYNSPLLTINQALWSAEAAKLKAFMSTANIAGITSRLIGSAAADTNFHLRPGLQIQNTGSITVQDPVDFSAGLANATTGAGNFQWRYGGTTLGTSQPGDLAVIAGGSLNIQNNITDGFLNTVDTNGNPASTLWSSGQSWSYTLTAGAPVSGAIGASGSALAASSPNQTLLGAGSLLVGTTSEPGVTVRTGTGSIALNAGQDVVLNNGAGQQDNVVYTAGVTTSAVLPHFGSLLALDPYGNTIFATPVIAQSGGNLSVNAGHDILGTDIAGNNLDGSWQSVNEWLFRLGAGTSQSPSVWWTDFASFQQGFGALAGGNLSLTAGKDIVRVGAVVPSSGYAVGGTTTQFNSGTLSVNAGGSIVQGLYYDEAGNATLRANSLQSNPLGAYTLRDVRLAQGSASMEILTRAGAQFDLPFNPTIISASAALTTYSDTNMFFTFGSNTSLDVQAAAGNLTALPPTGGLTLNGDNAGGNFYVTSTNVSLSAFGGSIAGSGWNNAVTQFPDANGQLRLLADGGISNLGWAMAQSDPGTLPTAAAPVAANGALLPISSSSTPLHAGDPTMAEIVARTGSILSVDFNLPKTTEISAGGNIGPLAVIGIQNSNADSLSRISAAGQITLTSGFPFDSITIAGQGAAQVVSGGPMNLGTDGSGITSIGNLNNPRLPALGASLIVAAGTGTQRLADGSVAAAPDYLNLITNFVRYDAFAAGGSVASAQLNSLVIAALQGDPTLAPLVQALQAGLAARASVNDPTSAFNQQLGLLSPAEIALGAAKLASAIQVVTNGQFIASANSDTFAPAYAAFNDLFPNLSASSNAIAQFVQSNPFAAQGASATSLLNQALAPLQTELVAAIKLGLADPKSDALPGSTFATALAAIDPATLQSDARALLASVLAVAGTSRDTLAANNQLVGLGSPYAKALTQLAAAYSPTTTAGLNDLNMQFSEIKAEQTGAIAIFAPRGSVEVGQDSAPVLDAYAKVKTASELGIFTLQGGDVIGLVRDNFDVFQSRVFTVAGGDISLWSSNENIDAGRGPRDVAVAAPPTLTVDPNTGAEYLDLGAAVTGSGIGALVTVPNQPPSNINLMAPAGYIDAGEAGIRAQNGKTFLGTFLVLNASNVFSSNGTAGGAVVTAPPAPPPPASGNFSGDKELAEAQREAIAQQAANEQRASAQARLHVSGEFIGFEGDCGDDKNGECKTKSDESK